MSYVGLNSESHCILLSKINFQQQGQKVIRIKGVLLRDVEKRGILCWKL